MRNTIAVLVLVVAACGGNGGMQHDAHTGPAMNFQPASDRLATGGHFVGAGAEQLAGEGFSVVVDLREEPPSGQREKLAALGLTWVHVPVSWENPQPAHFEAFRAAMAEHRDSRVLVQCAANYRASAMTYLYRVVEEDVPPVEAAIALHSVWQPNERWTVYLEEIIRAERKTP